MTGWMRVANLRSVPVLFAALAVAPYVVLLLWGGIPFTPPLTVHFWLVAQAAGLAAAASASLTLAGARFRDGRAVLLGTAFSTMTALLAVHGLATPGIIVGDNGVIAFAGALTLPAGIAVLTLTALPALRRPRQVAPLVALQCVLALLVLGLGAIGLLFPGAVPGVPAPKSPPALALLAASELGLLVLISRSVRTWQLTRRARDLLVAVGCAWLGASVITQLAIGFGGLAFYIGHALEIGGVALISIPAALDLRRGGASRPLVGDLGAPELVASEEAFLGPRVRSLVQQLAERDDSTAEHTRRVALLAARVAEELKLPAATRRHLAVGGLLHDIGKLSVPLAILQKPGSLTNEEYTEIKRHPWAGRRLLDELGGFPPTVRDLVSDHHERLDGKGYPRGLTAPELSLPVRILTVCDVYDALVSDRVYRNAWTAERAFELLRSESGDAFDPDCVEALCRVLGCNQDPDWIADVAREERRSSPTRRARRR
jgi:putative nucleotidyltransferase with HDIG domain